MSSAAAALGVSRQTVINRLHAVEERLGRPLGACAVEVEAALRLEELDQVDSHAIASLAALQPAKSVSIQLDTLPTRAVTQV